MPYSIECFLEIHKNMEEVLLVLEVPLAHGQNRRGQSGVRSADLPLRIWRPNPPLDRLVGLVVQASASTSEDPGFESRLRRHISGSSDTSDLKTGTPAAILSGAWRYRVSAWTGWPGVSMP